MGELSERDMSLAVDFVQGELVGAERERFELRLAEEADLAAAVEELLAMDQLARRAGAPASRSAPGRRRSLRLLALAVALPIAATILALLLREPPAERGRAPRLEFALAPGFESAGELLARLPELEGLHPPGLAELRGAGAPSNVDARTFVERARAAERARYEAWRDADEPPRAGFFVLPLRAEEALSVVVLGFPTRGAPLRYWPPPAEPASALERARLPAGEHVLPAPRFRLVEDPRGGHVEYERGFPLPLGAEGLELVIAARQAPLVTGTLAAVDALLSGPFDATSAAEELRALGFAPARARLLEP